METLAGKRGGQVLAGILSPEKFQEVERALKEMSDAAGAADDEMSIVEDSITFKLNALKETWIGVLQTLADRKDTGDLIDSLITISENITKITESTNGLKVALGGIAGALASFKGVGIMSWKDTITGDKDVSRTMTASNLISSIRNSKIAKSATSFGVKADDVQHIQAFANAMKTSTNDAKTWATTMGNASREAQNFVRAGFRAGQSAEQMAAGAAAMTTQVKASAVALNAVNTALSIGVAMLISFGVSILANKIDEITHKTERLNEEVEKTTSKISSLKSEIEKLESTEFKTSEENAKLRQLREELSVQEQLLNIEKKRANNTKYDIGIGGLFDKGSMYSQLAADYKSQREEERSYQNTNKKLQKAKKEQRKAIAWYDNNSSGWIESAVRKYEVKLKKLDDNVNALNDKRNEQLASFYHRAQDYQAIISEIQRAIDDNELDYASKENAEKLKREYQFELSQIKPLADEYISKFGVKNVDGVISSILEHAEFDGLRDKFIDLAKDGSLSIETLTEQFPELIAALFDAGVNAEELYNWIMRLSGNVDIKGLANRISGQITGKNRTHDERGYDTTNGIIEQYLEKIRKSEGGEDKLKVLAGLDIDWSTFDPYQAIARMDLELEKAGSAKVDVEAKFSNQDFSEKMTQNLGKISSAYAEFFKDVEKGEEKAFDIDKFESLRDSLVKNETDEHDNKNPFGMTADEFDRLEKIITSTTSTLEEQKDAWNEIATVTANIAWDELTDGIEKYDDETKQLIKDQMRMKGYTKESVDAFVEYKSVLSGHTNVEIGIDFSQERLATVQTEIQTLRAELANGILSDEDVAAAQERLDEFLNTEKLIQWSQDFQRVANEMSSTLDETSASLVDYTAQLMLANSTDLNNEESVNQLRTLLTDAGITADAIDKLIEIMNIYNQIASGVLGTNTQAVAQAKARAQQLAADLQKLGTTVDVDTEKTNKLTDAAKGAGGSAKDAAEEAEDALSKLSKQLDDLQSAYEKLCEIQETFNSTGKITVDQAQDLMNMDFRQVYAFVDETGTINATEEAYEDLASAKLYEMKVSLLMKAIDLISTFAEEGVAVEYLKGQYVSLAKAKALAAMGYEGADAVTALTGEMQAAAGAYAPGTASAEAAGVVMTAVLAQLKMLDNIDFSSISGASGAGDKEGGGAGADKASKEDASIEYFDFVERYLNKISKKVDKWLKSVDEMFTFWNKNWAIDRTMLQLEKQIKAQQQAAEVYLQQAEKAAWDVLPEGYEGATIFDIGPENSSMTYAELAKTGMMDVISFGGEDPGEAYTPMIKKQLEAYIEWLDKAEAEREKITELYSKEKELIKQKLSNITEYFDKIQQKFDSFINALDARIAVREASGKKGLLTDILKQFRAQYDALGLANEKLLAYITGTTKESQRSSEEVMADMAYEKSSMRDSVAYQVSKETKELYEYRDNIYKRTVNDIKELRQAVRDTDEKQAKKSLRERIAVLRDLAKQYNIGNMRRKWAKDLTKWTDTYASLFGASDDKQDIETALDELQRKTIKNKKDNNNIARYTKELETNADLEQGLDSEKYKSDVARRDQLLSRQKNFEELQQKLEEKEAARQAAFEAGDKETADALDQQIKEIQAAMQQRENKRLTVFEQDTLKILIQNIDRQEQMAAEQTEGTVRQYSQYYLDTVAEIQSLEQRILNSDRLTDQLNEYKAALAQAQADKNKEDVKKYRQLIKETNKQLKQKENKKLTKAEELRLHYLRESIDTMDEIEQEAMVDNNVADTAKYKELVTKITNLQNKKKRNNAQEKNLSMYLNELEAINSGVLQEDLTAYMRNYEQWWKLNEKLKTNGSLNVAQNNRLAKLTKIKEGYEKKYLEAQEARQAELEKAQIHEGDKLAEIEYNKNERLKEIDELYEKRVAESDAAAFENSAQYKQITGRIAQLQQLRDSGSKKFNKKAQKELDKLLEKQQALLNGATVDNFDAFNKAWEYVYRNREKYEAGKLKGAAAATYDKYVNMLNQWTQKKQDDVNAILREWDDAKKEIDTEYETQKSEYEAEVAEREEKTWEYAKAAAMSAIENMQAMIDGLDSMINAYKEIASLLENTTLENLTQYEGLAELLGLDSTKSLEDALKEKLTGAITKSKEKVKTLIEKGQMVTALRDALVEDGSEGMKQFIEQYHDQVSEENKELFEQLVKKGQKVLDKNSNMDELVTMLRNGETEGIDEKIQAILDAYTGEDKAGLENILKSARDIVKSGGTLDENMDLLFQWLDSTDYDETDTWIGELNDDLASIASEAVDTLEDVQKLKDEFRENIYFKAIDNAIDSLEKFQSKYSAMAGLISDEWTSDKNGRINEIGFAKINVLGQQLVKAQDAVDEYAKKIRAIDAAQGDWERAGYATKEDYIKDRNEVYAQYYNGLLDLYNIDQQIYNIGKQARQKEIDQLKEIINLRVDALRKKKEYYDYDRQIKNQTKNVELLQAQVEALNGVNTAEAKAQRQNLLAQLEETKDTLEDTQLQHEFKLSEDALNNLINDLDKTLDDANETVKQTLAEFIKTVRENLDAAREADVQGVYSTLHDVLMNVGYRNTESEKAIDVALDEGNDTARKQLEEEQAINSVVSEYEPITENQFMAGIQHLEATLNSDYKHFFESGCDRLIDISGFLSSLDKGLSEINHSLQKSEQPVQIDLTVNATIGNTGSMLDPDMNHGGPALPQKYVKQLSDEIKDSLYTELKQVGLVRKY